MNSLLLCRPSSSGRASRWLLASVHRRQGRTGHDHNSSLCQIPYPNCPQNIQSFFLSAPPFLQFPSAGLAESARLQTIVRRSKGEERRGGRSVCFSEEGGEMEMRKKAMLWLAFAFTVGSLGLLVAPGMVHGRDSTPLSFVKKTVASHSIVIFSKSYCPYCKRAKNVFKELEENPFVVELDQREDGVKIQDALFELVQRRTVPQVFIDGEHIGGSDDTLEAHRSGRLKKLLGSKQSGAWQHDIS